MHPTDSICKRAFFLHRSVPEAIGLFEPNFFLFWEENDYCWRARRAHLEIWTAPEAKVWCQPSLKLTPYQTYFWWRDRLLWIDRNSSKEEKKKLYRSVLFPAAMQLLQLYITNQIKSFFRPNASLAKEAALYKAGCRGILDSLRGKFGDCPDWL
jgi:GT2 family glycosyltransferase